ncbi:MAG: helix-turn-helix domain-containing protein [Chryseobacterium sp.]
MENIIIYQLSESSLFQLFNKWESEREAARAEQLKIKREETFLTPDETCEMLKVDRSTLWRWNKQNYLKGIRIGGKVRYRKSEICKMMEEV